MLKGENNLGDLHPPPPPPAFLFLPSSPTLFLHFILNLLLSPFTPPLLSSSLSPLLSTPRVTRCRQFHDCWLIYISAIMGMYEYLWRWSLAVGHLLIQPSFVCVSVCACDYDRVHACVHNIHVIFCWILCVLTVEFYIFISPSFYCVFLSESWEDITAGWLSWSVCMCVCVCVCLCVHQPLSWGFLPPFC